MLNINFDTLNVSGYCFGEKMYLRANLQSVVHPNLIVTPARKIGLNAPRTALSILYNGRNITNSLIEILIEEHFIIKSDDDKIVFRNPDISEEWDLNDLKTTEDVCDEINDIIQPLYERTQILKRCLQNCESFKGNIDDIEVKIKTLSETTILLIYHHHRNITQSLLDKLEDLNLLYRDNDRYFFIGDSNADVGPNFRISVLIQNALFFFTPLILICLILMIFSPPLAIIILLVATADFIVERNFANLNIVQRNKYREKKHLALYVLKWGLALTICTPILVSFLGGIGLLISIGLIILAIYIYKHR